VVGDGTRNLGLLGVGLAMVGFYFGIWVRYIDFQNHVIYYGRKCKAVFGRKKLYRPPGLVGPAAPLEFKRTICSPDSDR